MYMFFGNAPIPNMIAVPIFVPLAIAIFWSNLALAAKRLHDRGKSGWWVIPFFYLPKFLGKRTYSEIEGSGPWWLAVIGGLALSIWAVLELVFLRGVVGENQYGPDPLVESVQV